MVQTNRRPDTGTAFEPPERRPRRRRGMNALRVGAILTVGVLLGAGWALAEEEDACATGDQLVQADFPLPQVAAAVRQKQLDIAVVGSGSSTLSGSVSKAYPARL